MSIRHFAVRLLVPVALTVGCSNVRVTSSDKTATEQFLTSGAAALAIQQISAESLRDRKVYVEGQYLGASQKEFLLGEFRAHLFLAGVCLVDDRKDAQIIVEVRSGSVGTERSDFLMGLPPVVVPAIATNDATTGVAFITPELAVIKNVKQKGYADVAYVAYWADTREVIASSGPFIGRTYRHDWWFVGFGPYTEGDVPTTVPAPK